VAEVRHPESQMIVTVARDMVARKDSGTGGGGRQEILFTIEIAEEDVLEAAAHTALCVCRCPSKLSYD